MICKPYKNAKLSDISNPFGANPQWYGGIPHSGIDWVSSYGTPLVAPEDCIIDNIITDENVSEDLAPFARGYGIIMKGMSESMGGRFHLYWHCQPVFPVGLGQQVKQGEIVAFMGNSGFVMRGGVTIPVEIRSKPPYPGTHVHQEIFTFDSNSQRVYEDATKYIDWNISINYDLFTAIKVVLAKLINLLLKK